LCRPVLNAIAPGRDSRLVSPERQRDEFAVFCDAFEALYADETIGVFNQFAHGFGVIPI